jgi:hypothetical protein
MTQKKKDVKISTSIQLCEILYTDSQHMQMLSSAVASRYYNGCKDGSTSPGNYGYGHEQRHFTVFVIEGFTVQALNNWKICVI